MTFERWFLVGLGATILVVLLVVLRLAWKSQFNKTDKEGEGR